MILGVYKKKKDMAHKNSNNIFKNFNKNIVLNFGSKKQLMKMINQ
jgi:hypothetical protein